MPSAPTSERPWYETTFDRTWLRLHPHRDDGEARRHAPALLAKMGLKAGDRLLDVACGAGRWCRAFAARGLRVTGIDLSRELLEEASSRSPSLPGMPIYVRWDARALPFESQFDGAVSLFTSLGYFGSRLDDLQIVKGVTRALLPGGVFLIDYLNPAYVRATLVPEEWEEHAGLSVHVQRSLEEGAAGGPQVVKQTLVRNEGAGRIEATLEERVRLYEPAEIDALLVDAGLVLEGARCGGLDTQPFQPLSERHVRLARRPGRRG